ncbi:MAG: metallophosphoesterase [Pirellulaceae bacterium]
MRRRSYFVSDLHMFSRRSQAAEHEGALQQSAGKAKTFILGGDIFDFRWSTLPSTEATVAAAIRWLDELVGAHRTCDFHFVLGNHDCNSRFVDALDKYARKMPNLEAHPYLLRLGKAVFLHGDVADHPEMCAARLTHRRQHWSQDEKRRGPVKNMLYDWAVQARLHQICGKMIHPKKQVARRILGYLDRIGQGAESGTEQVYFGHTHQALAAYKLDEVLFHNPGAPIKGLDFSIVEVA